MSDSISTQVSETPFEIRDITPAQLQQLGVSQMAYVKPITMNGTAMFAIHGADGAPMALAEDRNIALAAIAQHEMIPTLVH